MIFDGGPTDSVALLSVFSLACYKSERTHWGEIMRRPCAAFRFSSKRTSKRHKALKATGIIFASDRRGLKSLSNSGNFSWEFNIFSTKRLTDEMNWKAKAFLTHTKCFCSFPPFNNSYLHTQCSGNWFEYFFHSVSEVARQEKLYALRRVRNPIKRLEFHYAISNNNRWCLFSWARSAANIERNSAAVYNPK